MSEFIDPNTVSPLLAAEDVPVEILQATMPSKIHLARLSVASCLIEQSFHGKPELLDRAAEVIDKNIQHPVRKYAAHTYDAFLPLFYARAEKRHPNEDELIDSFGALHDHLGELHQFLSNPEAITLARRRSRHQHSSAVSFINGIFAQSVTLYTGLYGAISQGNELLYPSSLREDNPTVAGVSQLYGRNVHDAHTYNPVEPSNRATLSIKHNTNSGGGSDVTRFNVMGSANTAARKILQTEGVKGFTEADLLSLFMAAEDPDSSDHAYAKQFRDAYAATLQSTIVRGQSGNLGE